MNWTDEEIDKLFQESASQMNVPPYQDAFWTEMEALLPKENKRKGWGWIFGGTLTCFALIAAMIFPVNQFSLQTAQQTSGKRTHSDLQENQTLASLSPVNSLVTLTQNEAAEKNNDQNLYPEAKSSTAPLLPKANTPSTQRSVESQKAGTLADIPAIEPLDGSENLALTAQTSGTNAAATDELQTENRLPLLTMGTGEQQLIASNFGSFKPKTRNHPFYTQMGVGMSQSFISGADKNWMPALNFGAGYQYRPQGFGFSAGINIQGSFSNNLEFTRRSKIYNFSSTNYVQNFKYKQLYSLELPFSIDYRKNKHVVSLGIAPTYLVTTVMKFSQSENGALSETQNYIGQRAGLNSFGLKPSISYQLEISRSWYLGIQLNTQLFTQIDDKQFVGEQTKLPLSGQITVRKTIMR